MLRFFQTLFARNESGGDRGERLAAAWLKRQRGFTIVTQNWRNPRDRRDEIDLVCRDGEVLVFVEVKARAAGALVPGYHAVDERKKRVLRRAIQAYLGLLAEKPLTFRFDVVEVSLAKPAKAIAPAFESATRRATSSAPADSTSAIEPEVLHFENVPLFSKYFRG